MNRRNSINFAGYFLGASPLAPATPQAVFAGTQRVNFNIHNTFVEFMTDIEGSADDAGGTVSFTRDTCYGKIARLVPQVWFSKIPGRWANRLVTV